MKLCWFSVCLIPLLFASINCRTIIPREKQDTIPTSIEPPRSKKGIKKGIVDVGYTRVGFLSFLNQSHPGNRVGYRFFEHKPFVYGAVPKKSETRMETITAKALTKQYARRPGVFVHTIDVTNKEGWTPQTWTYYIVPVADGFDLLWVITTKDKGLNEYYSAQQCFRMSGKTNREWRRQIAETPAFSEYDLWAAQEAKGQPKTSLSFVRRNSKWEEIPATQEHIVCRTPLGLAMDTARSGGNLSKIPDIKPPFAPRHPSRFEDDIDCGLVTRSNLENNWVCALYWERTTHISNHHPADCLHSFANLGPLAPHSKRAIRGKIYWMKASKDELFARWQKDWPN